MKKRRKQFILSLVRKSNPENDKNDIDFRCSDEQGEDEGIAKADLIESLKRKLMKIFILSKLLEDCMIMTVSYKKRKKKLRSFFEVIWIHNCFNKFFVK